MTCADCGGLVTWRGPLSNLTHTECERCGHRNCQEVDEPATEREDDGDNAWVHDPDMGDR